MGDFEILAPCIGTHRCYLDENDWCHFSLRVERSSLLRRLKEGDKSYEDEKYSYVLLVRKDLIKGRELHKEDRTYRILRHPNYGKGYGDFILCGREEVLNRKFTKSKDKEVLKGLKKLSWGDSFTIE